MATCRRLHAAGATWFFTLATEARRPLLTRSDSLRAIAGSAKLVKARYPLRILGWVILPDHLHVLLRLPEGDSAYARPISIFKRQVSRRIACSAVLHPRDSMRRRHEPGFWQRRFWEHLIRDDDDLHRHLDCIHFNAVNHGMTPAAADWPHSSFHGYAKRGVLSLDWAGNRIDPAANAYGE